MDSPFTLAERLESTKAALVGGLGALGVTVGVLGVNRVLQAGIPISRTPWSWAGWGDWGLGMWLGAIGCAIAALSGALFALTYRYAVRRDGNPQLKGGVILAFTLVRSLAQVDAASALSQRLWPFAWAIAYSLLLFGTTALLLELGCTQGWLHRFPRQ